VEAAWFKIKLQWKIIVLLKWSQIYIVSGFEEAEELQNPDEQLVSHRGKCLIQSFYSRKTHDLFLYFLDGSQREKNLKAQWLW
jgi:hypothetical protein